MNLGSVLEANDLKLSNESVRFEDGRVEFDDEFDDVDDDVVEVVRKMGMLEQYESLCKNNEKIKVSD